MLAAAQSPGGYTVAPSARDTAEINEALRSGTRAVYLPCGTYRISDTLDARNQSNLRLFGAGECSVIQPVNTFPNHHNLLDLSGSKNIEIDHLAFDMSAVTDPESFGGTVIFGGPTEPIAYGPVFIHDNFIKVSDWQGIGVGTSNPGAVLVGLQVVRNRIHQDACQRNACGNAIDTGSTGTRRNVKIAGNEITYPSQKITLSGAGGDAIFCGHGHTSEYQITGNAVSNPPGDGLQVYARPFGPDDTQPDVAAEHYVISNNTISNTGRHGIAVYGGSDVRIQQNVVRNPGGDGLGDGAQGITLTFGIRRDASGEHAFPPENIVIVQNKIVDALSPHVMQHGIDIESKDGLVPSAVIWNNLVSGAAGTDLGYFHADARRIQLHAPSGS